MTRSAARVRETTSNAAGTSGDFDLDGPEFGFRSFVAGAGDGASVFYLVHNFDDEENPTSGDWEAGKGTIAEGSPDTLSRDTILGSSNGGAAVNWGAGAKVAIIPSPVSGWLDGDDNLSGITSASAARENLELGSAATANQGSGNGLDADLLETVEASGIWQKVAAQTLSGDWAFQTAVSLSGTNAHTGQSNFNATSSSGLVLPVGANLWVDDGGTKRGGSAWIEGTELHYVSASNSEWKIEGTFVAAHGSAKVGSVWVDTDFRLHYIDASGDERRLDQETGGFHGDAAAIEGSLWVEGSYVHAILDGGGQEGRAHFDVAHGDGGHADHDDHGDQTTSHGDSSHGDHDDHSDHDDHGDVTHADGHGDHDDVIHVDAHGDVPHTDSGTGHDDSSTHDDASHSDTPASHSDSSTHDDAAHDDVAHDDQPVEVGA